MRSGRTAPGYRNPRGAGGLAGKPVPAGDSAALAAPSGNADPLGNWAFLLSSASGPALRRAKGL